MSFSRFLPDMSQKRSLKIACWIVPLVFGVYSLMQGADSNWDLRNYHLYNAFAALHGKLTIDLAPAAMQSYFNPLLDIPYYIMAMSLPAVFVGFAMGVLHGCNFVLILAICHRVLADLPTPCRNRTAFWLALSGCFTANFMSGIGNSMGDNTTSLFSLASLLIILSVLPQMGKFNFRVALIILMGGVVSGLGAGLKLTTVVYSAALCAGLLFVSLSASARLRVAFIFGLGVLLGLATTGGFWLFKMWHMYGNPIYPQYSSIFPSPLTYPVGAVDAKWFPHSFWEALVFPFVFSIDSERTGQIRLHQAIWAIAYIVFWWWLATVFLRRRRNIENVPEFTTPTGYVVVYVCIGYLLWMKLFSIQRYLVSIEICAPLFLYLLFTQILGRYRAQKVSTVLLTISSLGVLIGGAHTWGHDRWAWKMFSVDVPAIAQPTKATVLLTSGDPPMAWLVPMFPDKLAFASLEGPFPRAMPAYDEKIHHIVMTRGGTTYALIPGYWRQGVENITKDAIEQNTAKSVLLSYGFKLNKESCRTYLGHIGSGTYPYQWCYISELKIGLVHAPPAAE
ncbi:hypothetical protein [Bordetella sp. FB-8]|uniref:hypothetical protein n=1 Tax=Bordetella sp. FB-8 TaxID=1159870 RepID=UPI00039DB1F1|nr:hypothetical protein [Bordetella sp. FB-8]